MSFLRRSAAAACLCLLLAPPLKAQDGFASNVTGGAGGKTEVARDGDRFRRLANTREKTIIQVEGTVDIGLAKIGPNKTIVGIGSNPTVVGTMSLDRDSQNIIIQNLTFTHSGKKGNLIGEDLIEMRNSRNIWVDHCTFSDAPDGLIDMTHGTDKVTISWCKFQYTSSKKKHRFTMLAMGGEKDKKEGIDKDRPLRITLHHNWWAKNCDSRMPAARLAKVHMYNNYFSCEGNSYCTNARGDTEMLSESNYYDGVKNPCYKEENARLKVVNNIYDGCEGKAERRNDKVFDPPYSYSVDPVERVPDIVRHGAGAR